MFPTQAGAADPLPSLSDLSLDTPARGSGKGKARIAEDVREQGEGKSSPVGFRDPQAALIKFIDHLLSPEHADTEPHLPAIGYELEALLSMYPDSLKLSVSSRPQSLALNPISPESELPPPIPNPLLQEDIPPPPAGMPLSLPMGFSSSSLAGRRGSVQWSDAVFDESVGLSTGERIRYEVILPAWEEGEMLQGVSADKQPEMPPRMRVLVSLPPTYPTSSPPQLQLLGRYLGSFPIDAGLFGDITRTYIASSGVPFTSGDVCVFEGLTHVQSLVRKWYTSRLSEGAEGDRLREADRQRGRNGRAMQDIPSSIDNYLSASDVAYSPRPSPVRTGFSYTRHPGSGGNGAITPDAVHDAQAGELGLTSFKIVSSEPIVDRRSTFVGHAVRVTDEREVPLVIHELLSDRKIAKAAHPAMFAYRIARDVGGVAGKVFDTDYDDDGESQSGGRLKHLLEILELENVLVVVSRWYGGTLLGADRFKHISQAARDALEAGGFLDDKEKAGEGKRGRKK